MLENVIKNFKKLPSYVNKMLVIAICSYFTMIYVVAQCVFVVSVDDFSVSFGPKDQMIQVQYFNDDRCEMYVMQNSIYQIIQIHVNKNNRNNTITTSHKC